ncbi:DUF1254 domain-containing protein [Burkholderia guangdongensis]|uniref:DUF1254 domain-containing protein n=1 Tax=Burkholderia guangdongensis TaxID=1792500 RepID=UPI0015C82360|nr:DUF1254 domain-containing protein [Burkholderia guangdongensis]
MTTIRRKTAFAARACVPLAVAALLAGCAARPDAIPQQTGWMRAEVSDAYLYAYPLVLMETAMDAATAPDGDGAQPGRAPLNVLRHAHAPAPVGAANPAPPGVDTLDSTGWLDVEAGPVIVTLPAIRGRYWDARALDMWTDVLWSSGAAVHGARAAVRQQTIAFVAKGWQGELPAGATRVDVPTRHAWFALRIRSTGGRDAAAVRKLQSAIRIASSAAGPSPVRDPALGDAPHAGTPAQQVAVLDPAAFFTHFARALADDPAPGDDPHARQMLADIGVAAGAPVRWSGDRLAAASAGVADARARLASPPPNLLAANGWRWLGDAAGRYGDDYVLRAYAASTRFGAATRDDETVALVRVDSDGHPLNGANRYVLHFSRAALPPARAFWTLTPYTAAGALPDVGAHRRSLGDVDRLRRNRDGSIDVVVSAAAPGGARASNWLPAPRADFALALRLYAPMPNATDGTWQPPAVVRE